MIGQLQWKCAACGEWRPDRLIGVAKAAGKIRGGLGAQFSAHQNYCLDRPNCYRIAQGKADAAAAKIAGEPASG